MFHVTATFTTTKLNRHQRVRLLCNIDFYQVYDFYLTLNAHTYNLLSIILLNFSQPLTAAIYKLH